MSFTATTTGGMLKYFINNIPEVQIEEKLKSFQIAADNLKVKRADYVDLGVVVDIYHIIDKEMFDFLCYLVDYTPYKERDKITGNVFLYFKNLKDAERAADYLRYVIETNTSINFCI